MQKPMDISVWYLHAIRQPQTRPESRFRVKLYGYSLAGRKQKVRAV